VTYFANVGGGVHLGPAKPGKDATYALIDELVNKVGADTMDGVFFELLSIGQAIGRSDDLKRLVAAIRENSPKVPDNPDEPIPVMEDKSDDHGVAGTER
jgi:hypothetical protein